MLKIEIIGNIGNDAEVKESNGNKFITFSVAHTEKRNGSERTTWVSCTKNGDGGALLQYLKKGVLVFVRGTLSVEAYQGRNGIGADIKCYTDDIQLLHKSSNNSDIAPEYNQPSDQPF